MQKTQIFEKSVFAMKIPSIYYCLENVPGCGNNIPIPIARIRIIGKWNVISFPLIHFHERVFFVPESLIKKELVILFKKSICVL